MRELKSVLDIVLEIVTIGYFIWTVLCIKRELKKLDDKLNRAIVLKVEIQDGKLKMAKETPER